MIIIIVLIHKLFTVTLNSSTLRLGICILVNKTTRYEFLNNIYWLHFLCEMFFLLFSCLPNHKIYISQKFAAWVILIFIRCLAVQNIVRHYSSEWATRLVSTSINLFDSTFPSSARCFHRRINYFDYNTLSNS